MRLKLQVVQGVLKNPKPADATTEIDITTKHFMIGTAADCQMRCAGHSIDPHHCVILVERDRVVVRDEGSRGGTLVNGLRIDGTACLFHGDRLQVGRLAFDVCLQSGSQVPSVPPSVSSQRETVAHVQETIADLVVDLLTEADEQDREKRRFDPAVREFRLTPPPSTDVIGAEASGRKRPPEKRPPAKLPPPPPIRGNDSVDAANQALTALVTPPKKKT